MASLEYTVEGCTDEKIASLFNEIKSKVPVDFPESTVEPLEPGTRHEGGWNVHFKVTDSEGVKWLARARLTPDKPIPKEVLTLATQSEVATLVYLATADASIPRVQIPDKLEDYYLIQPLPGKPASGPIDIKDISDDERPILFRDFAAHYITLSNFGQHSGIGSLRFTSDASDFEVGPLLGWEVVLPDAPHFTGPFKTNLERWTDRINQTLRGLDEEANVTFKVAAMYLAHLELRRVINTSDELREEEQDHYIIHGDGKGYHFLIDKGRLGGVLDWDWSHTTTKAEAFTAAPAFMDVKLFFEGSNELSEAEGLLLKAYLERGRYDLAECVTKGKKYQRLWTMVGSDRIELPSIKGLQAAFGQEVDKEQTLGQWCKMAATRFKGEVPEHISDFMASYE